MKYEYRLFINEIMINTTHCYKVKPLLYYCHKKLVKSNNHNLYTYIKSQIITLD